MDINAKKVEIIQHIIMIQNPETLIKIDRFIHGLEDDPENHNLKKELKEGDRKSRVNVVGSKIKSMLNMYE
ncbi:MAG: hypothetical protein R2764_17045 [Bacteroidales bacterium]